MLASISRIVIPPAVVLIALGIYHLVAVNAETAEPELVPQRQTPWQIEPTNLEPRIATDDQMRQVLERVLPPVEPVNTNNLIHALRLWGVEAKFDDPKLPTGEQMRDYFLDDRVFQQFAGHDAQPLFIRDYDGVRARDFDENFAQRYTSSFHNDDLLATLAEVGTPLDTTMHLRDGTATVEELLIDSLRRFNADRWEFEWSMISYLRYLYPERNWENKYGETITLPELVQMCVARTGERPGSGPCKGQHRLEALVVLLKIDDQIHTMHPQVRQQLVGYLKNCSDRLVATQSPEGYWTANWVTGTASPDDAKASADEKLLVTGHTLEWLALAPEEVLPPRENIVRAGQWTANEVIGLDEKRLFDHYGPYSHAARALSLWHGMEAWGMWQKLHSPKSTAAETTAP